jgi:hypothetical protein
MLTAARLALALLAAAPLPAGPPAAPPDDVPLRAMRDELARSMERLRLQEMERPYFLAYRVEDRDALDVTASLGSLTSVEPKRSRQLSVELRVGGYDLDSSGFFSPRSFRGPGAARRGPLDDSYQELRRQLWLATDAQYRQALEDLSAKRAALKASRRTAEPPDFGREAPRVEAGAVARTEARREDLEGLARELSGVFLAWPAVQRSSVHIEAGDVVTRFVNSEGGAFTRWTPTVRLRIEAETRAEDGLPVADVFEVTVRRAAELPPRQQLVAEARKLGERILAIRAAPSLERYNGPVLFEGEAAPELFAQQLASGLIAVRQPVSDDPSVEASFGQLAAFLGGSLQEKLGGRILPEFLGVVDAPQRGEHQGAPLLGGWPVDDDGVLPRETVLVDHGKLKTLLTTRVPVRSLRASTGSHRGPGPAPSNLIVTSERGVAAAQLRRELLKRAAERGLDFAIVVRRVGGGTGGSLARLYEARMGGRGSAGAAAMAEVFRVRADGSEERLRGVELAELSTASFKEIVAAGDAPAVYTGQFVSGMLGMFGGGWGWGSSPPIFSCVAPALLFDEVSLAGSRGPFPAARAVASPLARR